MYMCTYIYIYIWLYVYMYMCLCSYIDMVCYILQADVGPEGTKRATCVHVRLRCLRTDLRTGSIP